MKYWSKRFPTNPLTEVKLNVNIYAFVNHLLHRSIFHQIKLSMNLKKVKSFSKISDDLSNKFIKSGILIARWASEAPPVFPTLSWEGWWSGTITKMVKGIDSWEFPKEQSLVEDKPESGTQKYSKCQTPPHMKKTSCF